MKYIRTKDGIIDLSKVTIGQNGWKDKKEYIAFKQEEQKETIKQADTIEELCDEAVFFDKDNVPHYKSKEGNIWYLGAGLFIESLRYCIFTDKGLIYVAKMNEKGELELL